MPNRQLVNSSQFSPKALHNFIIDQKLKKPKYLSKSTVTSTQTNSRKHLNAINFRAFKYLTKMKRLSRKKKEAPQNISYIKKAHLNNISSGNKKPGMNLFKSSDCFRNNPYVLKYKKRASECLALDFSKKQKITGISNSLFGYASQLYKHKDSVISTDAKEKKTSLFNKNNKEKENRFLSRPFQLQRKRSSIIRAQSKEKKIGSSCTKYYSNKFKQFFNGIARKKTKKVLKEGFRQNLTFNP